MKFRTITRTVERLLLGACMTLVAGFAVSCSDDDKETAGKPYDPSQPVVITGFTPETAGYQEDIIVTGQNFGTDKKNVTLTLGGKQAVIVNVMGDKLYAFVPSGAYTDKNEETGVYTGEIEISVSDGEGNVKSAKASKLFRYIPKRVVGTLCGYQNENDSQGEVWGSFDVAAGFNSDGCFTFDPLYPNRLYIAYDRGDGFIAQLDLEARTSTRLMTASKFNSKRLRNIAFTLDGKYMLVSTDRDDNNFESACVWIVERNSNGTFSDASSAQVLSRYKQCNGVAVHPINGEIYFNSYSNGELFRLDPNDYFNTINAEPDEDGKKPEWTGLRTDGAFRELFKIQDPSYEFQITIHPSGDYAYLTVINRDYILRTDYDHKKKEFTTPYVVAGANGAGDWVDAVGSNARLHKPYQGVFVKNPQYVEEGRQDVYDYYFCDYLNFCVRYITPDGLVRTYAGRAPSTNGNIWGTEDGDLRLQARFRDVSGLAYDEERDRFYVLDHNNRRVRTIGMESTDIVMTPPADDDETEGGEGTEGGEE